MDFNTSLVLVTGAAGWLGVNLTKALAHGLPDCDLLAKPVDGLRIRCLILPGQDARLLKEFSPLVEIVEGDLTNPADCAGFCRDAAGAIVFHTAGIIHPDKVSDFYRINLNGTENILAAASQAGARRMVVVSSNSPCGCNPHPDHLFSEESPYHPYMNYGRSKMKMEMAVQACQQGGKMETVIIRPPWFYGPFQPPRQTLFFRMIRDGKMPIVGSGENLRSMAYVDNICQGLILAAMTANANGRTYWIADERPYSMNEIVDTVERLLETEFGQHCTHKRTRLPGFASEIALAIDATLQSVGLYHQKIHVLSEMNKTIACSIDRAKAELGYRPSISLEEGMRRSIASLPSI